MENNESPYLIELERIRTNGYLNGLKEDYTAPIRERYKYASEKVKAKMDENPDRYLAPFTNGTFQANHSLMALMSIKKNIQFIVWLIIISICAYFVILLLAQKSF